METLDCTLLPMPSKQPRTMNQKQTSNPGHIKKNNEHRITFERKKNCSKNRKQKQEEKERSCVGLRGIKRENPRTLSSSRR